jgi:hypothetical protein
MKCKPSTMVEKKEVVISTFATLTNDEIRKLDKMTPDEVIESSTAFRKTWHTMAGIDYKLMIDGEPVASAQAISWIEDWSNKTLPSTPVAGTLILAMFTDIDQRSLLRKLRYDSGFDITLVGMDELGNKYEQSFQGITIRNRQLGISIDDLCIEHRFDFRGENVTDISLTGPTIDQQIQARLAKNKEPKGKKTCKKSS